MSHCGVLKIDAGFLLTDNYMMLVAGIAVVV